MSKIFSPHLSGMLYQLGYEKPDGSYVDNLLSIEKVYDNKNISFHNKKVIKELKPSATYFIDNKPFILFFENQETSNLNKKIWNAQIPVAIFCSEGEIKIFNGISYYKTDNRDDFKLTPIKAGGNEFSYWNISDSDFWKKFDKAYEKPKLNEILLDNIKTITEKLKDLKIPSAISTKIVIRLIFIRFLIDRDVNLNSNILVHSDSREDLQNNLIDVIKDKTGLYDFFGELKGNFNGNLFEIDESEKKIIERLDNTVFKLLSRFISGKEEIKKEQPFLFPLYDFNIIPVELISNAYETLLGDEKRDKDNAFYTPSNLVDYILNITIDEYLIDDKKSCKVLDPSCGSGIFLVESYKRIVEKNLLDKGEKYFKDDATLTKLLKDNIFGVDKNEEAIDVSIFSLYLAFLDYKDPKSLVCTKLPNLKGENLIDSDFFNDEKLEKIKNTHFDFIIGNPPWGGDKKELHIDYCKNNKFPNTSDKKGMEISRSFVYKCREYANADTTCCLILPAKLLYNQQKPARKYRTWILENTKIEKIIELSSVRKLVFKNAIAPASIMMFKIDEDNSLNNKIVYISIKPNIYFKLFKIIVIEKNDIKYIKQKLLYDYDWAWKTIVYGSSWDFEIIKQIKQKYKKIEDILKEHPNIINKTGIQDSDKSRDKNDASHHIGHKILDSNKSIDHFYIDTSSTSEFKKPKIHTPKDEKLFKPPSCLVMKGSSSKDFKMKSVYYDQEYLLFKEAIYIIKGEKKDEAFLKTLTALFNSSFYAYLNLMLGYSIGIEREQRSTKEIKKFPFPNNSLEHISELVTKIQENKKKENEGLLVENKSDKYIAELDNLILEVFNFKDNVFVDYALNVQIPQLTNTYKKPPYKYLEKYAEIFLEYFNRVYNKHGKYIKVIFHHFKPYIVFELIICDKEPDEKISHVYDVDIDFKQKEYIKLALYQTNDIFYNIKDIIYFEKDSFCIIKTNEYKNWHPAIAEIDLSGVIDDIMTTSDDEGQ